MSLHREKENFDKNDDGRLSGLEYTRWYYHKYGHDMEMAERQARADRSIQLSVRFVCTEPQPDPATAAADMAEKTRQLEAEIDCLIDESTPALERMTLDELEALQARFDELEDRLYDVQPRDMDSPEWQHWSELDDRISEALMTAEEYIQEIINPD